MAKGTVGYELAAATATDILEVPNGYTADVTYIRAFNNTGQSKTVTLSWVGTNEAGTARTVNIFGTKTIAAQDSLSVIDLDFVMRPGDTLVATSEAGADIDILITFELDLITTVVNLERG